MAALKGNPTLSPAAADVVHRNVSVRVQHVDGTASTFMLDMIDPTLTYPILQGEAWLISCIDVNSAGFSSDPSPNIAGVATPPAGSAPATPVVLGCSFAVA